MTERILCLDNDINTLEVVADFLRGESYVCDITLSVADALESLETGIYSLFITELELNTGNGIEVVHKARGMDDTLACIVTASAMDVNDAMEILHAGASDFVIKPFHLGTLAFVIENALERRRLLIENKRYQTKLEDRVREATAELEIINAELRRTKDYLENLLNSSVDTVLTINADYSVVFVNNGVKDMLGYSPDELSGKLLSRLFRGGQEEIRCLFKQLQFGPIRNYETEMLHNNDSLIPVMMSVSFIHDPDGEQTSILAICRDITQQKQMENELKEMTIKDSLTDLYNQRYFYQRLEIEIERSRRQNHPLSLLLFDVDHFKEYNDTHGHLEGDRVLQAIGEVVRECTRDYVDIGCRYGGDEFTVILPETDQIHARNIAERIRISFEARRFGGCTLSVGLMTYRKDSSPQSFIRFADEMMYDAKRSGGNRVYMYQPEKHQVILENNNESGAPISGEAPS